MVQGMKNITAFDRLLLPILKYIDFLERTRDFFAIQQIVKNWKTVVFFRVGLKHKFIMILRTGKKIDIREPRDYQKFWASEEGQNALLNTNNFISGVKVDLKKGTARFNFKNKHLLFYYDSPKQLINTYALIRAQFIKEEYGWLRVDGKNVVDIGANVGDTAIYFSLKGANHVYAYEPYPYSYNIATKNITINSLGDKITLLNEGCGKKHSQITIEEDYKNYSGTNLKGFKTGKNIKITTLENLTKEFNLEDAALKIDCEGCEYNVILNAPVDTLRKFDQIVMEYHYGYLDIKEKLERAGFMVKNTKPKYNFNSDTDNDMLIGMLYAERQ